jgi:hypothetical protein
MATAISWSIAPEEKINAMTEDGVNIVLFAGKGMDSAGTLDAAPRFRYIVAISEMKLEEFYAASAKLLFDAALLILPYVLENGRVSGVVLMNTSQRMVRISHGEHPGGAWPTETEGRKQTSWTTQHHRHHHQRSPVMRPRSPPERDV